MDINKFAPNLSFFFSNSLDPEYTVIGRVARRIWAVFPSDMYGADERSQTRVPHSDEWSRLHARDRLQRHPNHPAGPHGDSRQRQLPHTNAYDEAITTPTEESVPRLAFS